MTRIEFDKAKFLLKRGELVAAGIPSKAIGQLTAAGKLTFVVLVPHGMRYYHKAAVMKVLGIS